MHRVFGRPQNLLALVGFTTGIYVSMIWLPQASLVLFIFTHTSFENILKILLPLLGGLLIETPFSAAVFSLIFALLVSFNIVLLAFFIRMNHVASGKFSFNTILGSGAGLCGIGCAVCGSTLIASSTFFLGGLLISLPYHGLEIGYAGLVLLLFSAYKTVHAINVSVDSLD